MRMSSIAAVVFISLSASAAVAQTSPAPATPPAAQTPSTSATVPVPRSAYADGKRAACRQEVISKGLKGQEQRDQMQLCMAQGQLDCVTQAISQKAVGPQRKEFMKTCMGRKIGGDR